MAKWRYGVIFDAGSSGTRLHVYRWLDPARAVKEATSQQLKSLPELKTKKSWTKKIHPGVSTWGDKPNLVGPEHLDELLKEALEIVPKDDVEDTPIFLLATAGVRLLPVLQRKELLAQICNYARSNTKFLLPDCDLHIQAIPGETEGLYGWVAANYLLGGFDYPDEHTHGKGHHTYGFLDMGGASAQIAFAPNVTEAERHAEDLKLLRMRSIDGANAEYRVFVTTWLGFGVHEARKRYVEALLEESGSPDIAELPDPCLPKGLEISVEGDILLPGVTIDGKSPHLIGTGQFKECLKRTYPLLDKDAPCEDQPCLLHGVHVPAIDFSVNHFVGVSEYWHTTHEVFEMAYKDKAYDFQTYQERVKNFCIQDWDTISKGIEDHKWGKKVDNSTAAEVCFKASWLINVMHDGIGIPRVGLENTSGNGYNGTKEVLHNAKEKGFNDPFQAVDKIDDTEVSWTLGKMVLYAASQIPPTDKSPLPVGFGSNVAGIPADFQFAGSNQTSLYHTTPQDTGYDDDDFDADSWHDTLFEGKSPRRVPGFLLFILIIIIAMFLLCGRDRRSRLFRRFPSPFSTSPRLRSTRRRRFLGSKVKLPSIFSQGLNSSGGNYERVAEEGPDPDDFELGDLDADSDDSLGGLKAGRTSGWATPHLNGAGGGGGGTPGLGLGDRESRAGTHDGPGAGVGLGLGGRSGLFERTESRERLTGLSLVSDGGRKSRRSSPSRHKSPLMMAGLRED